jgi:hypothetical protein
LFGLGGYWLMFLLSSIAYAKDKCMLLRTRQ